MRLVEEDRNEAKEEEENDTAISFAINEDVILPKEVIEIQSEVIEIQSEVIEESGGSDLTDPKDIVVDICPKDEEIFVSCLSTDLFMTSER